MSTTTTLHRWDIPDGAYAGSCTLWVDAAGRVTGGFDRRTGEIPKGRHSNADEPVSVLGYSNGSPVQLSLRDYIIHSRERGLLVEGSPAAAAAAQFLGETPIWKIPPPDNHPDHSGEPTQLVSPAPSAEPRGKGAGKAREQRAEPD
jgi:hypothetical protein